MLLRPRPALAVFALLLGLTLPACSHKVVAPHVENLRPEVRLTNAPTVPSARYDYAYQMRWSGFDPDGQVAHFIYALDPPAPSPVHPEPETTWVSTQDNGQSFSFTASIPDPVVPGVTTRSSDYHVFVIKAVDNKGLVSEPAISAFNSQTIAPQVMILSPTPNGSNRQFLSPSLTIQWKGDDPDGLTRKTPLFYRVKLLTQTTPITPAVALQFPDSVRSYYLPRNWAGWDSLGGDVTSYQLTSLSPEQDYAFCVVGFDEAGAFSPVVSSNSNLLYFRTVFAQFGGPKFTLFNDFFNYTYRTAAYRPDDPAYEIRLEVPANAPFTLNWQAEPYPGTTIAYYRWVVDPENISDNAPRANERTDVHRWSQPNAGVTHITIDPLVTGGDHHFYVEVGDNNGLRSLGHVHFQTITANFDHDLGIVDDTRLDPDRKSTTNTATCIDRPLGRWPTAAELDTFLYARGGVPIRCYPAGSVSRTGLFWGYDYDTLNTRTGQSDISLPLSRLSHYRRLIWLVDAPAAALWGTPSDLSSGMTALRFMNQSGRPNTLGSYLRLGGEVWLAGGGSIVSSLMGPISTGFLTAVPRSFSPAAGNLIPGRFAYDFAHWRSEIRPGSGASQIRRNLGRLESTPGIYAQLPTALQSKSLAAGDSLPAWRTNGNEFYLTSFDLEALTVGNRILEDANPDPLVDDFYSTMDTLYTVTGGSLGSGVVMTVYHGSDNSRVIVSGFSLWSFQRAQLKQLIDGVLQGVWGLSRHAQPQRLAAPRPWQPVSAAVGPARR